MFLGNQLPDSSSEKPGAEDIFDQGRGQDPDGDDLHVQHDQVQHLQEGGGDSAGEDVEVESEERRQGLSVCEHSKLSSWRLVKKILWRQLSEAATSQECLGSEEPVQLLSKHRKQQERLLSLKTSNYDLH